MKKFKMNVLGWLMFLVPLAIGVAYLLLTKSTSTIY